MNKLEISLSAIAENYSKLCAELDGADCAAVVKANGYGLGALEVATKLESGGCRNFFVATFEEAVDLRKTIKQNNIFVFHGAQADEVDGFKSNNLIPVLNNTDQLKTWPKELAAAIHFDTGMTRLGFSLDDVDEVKKYNIVLIMSHLASADYPEEDQNAAQLKSFRQFAVNFPNVTKSLANSYGIYLGKDYHFDLARPGIALYGGNPQPGKKNPMTNVVTLKAPIIQVHEITKPTKIGYNGIFEASAGDVIGTVAIGYADGIQRSLSNKGKAYAYGVALPYSGRVSMDLITIKLNNLPPQHRKVGEMVEILGNNYTICDMAKDAGTIEYEIITRLGQRFERIYT